MKKERECERAEHLLGGATKREEWKVDDQDQQVVFQVYVVGQATYLRELDSVGIPVHVHLSLSPFAGLLCCTQAMMMWAESHRGERILLQ